MRPCRIFGTLFAFAMVGTGASAQDDDHVYVHVSAQIPYYAIPRDEFEQKGRNFQARIRALAHSEPGTDDVILLPIRTQIYFFPVCRGRSLAANRVTRTFQPGRRNRVSLGCA